jgi:hypothetical protein
LHFDGLIDKAGELARQGFEDRVDIRSRNPRCTTSSRCGANNPKSLALRASTQKTSARALALASRAIKDGGVAMA